MSQNWKLPEITRPIIGKFFKDRREELGLSAWKVAKKADLQAQQYQAIESGTVGFTDRTLYAILDALDLYIFFAPRDGNHLNHEHMLKKIDEHLKPGDLPEEK